MYVLATKLTDLPVMSLQIGAAIATIERPIINPANLEALALRVKVAQNRTHGGVILLRDVRQFAGDCVIVDSFDEIEDVSEIVRLREVAEKDFDPLSKSVVNESGHRLGRVEDYTINLKTLMVQKLYVHQSLMRSILFNNLVIDRTQIIDVSAKQFTVRDASITEPNLQAVPTVK